MYILFPIFNIMLNTFISDIYHPCRSKGYNIGCGSPSHGYKENRWTRFDIFGSSSSIQKQNNMGGPKSIHSVQSLYHQAIGGQQRNGKLEIQDLSF